MSRSMEFDQGQGQARFKRLEAGHPDLEEHVGQKATLIEGPRRWRGTLDYNKYGTQSLHLMIGKKTMRSIDAWRGHVLEVGEDSEARFKHWKKHGTDKSPADCPSCRSEGAGP